MRNILPLFWTATRRLCLYHYNYTCEWSTGNVQVGMALSVGPQAVTAPFLMLLLGD